MRVLAVTNMFPTRAAPANGVFVEEQIKGLRARGLQVRVLFVDRRRQGPLVYYRLGPRLRTAVNEFAPDLLHIMYGGVMAQQGTSILAMPPIVVTFHGSDLLGENLHGWQRKVLSHYGVLCSRVAARRAEGVIVVAQHLLRPLGKKVERKKVRVIPCGIDLERFKPMDHARCREQLGWQPDRFHVLFATSAGDAVKQPELARAAVAELQRDGRRVDFHIMSGVPNSEVPVWLNASDVLLLTSKHEGSPTIVKEALACGLPVVSVKLGDVPERLEGIDGCHLAEADPAALARKLAVVFERRQRLNCRDKLQELSCEAAAGNLEGFYQQLITQRAAAIVGSRYAKPWERLNANRETYSG